MQGLSRFIEGLWIVPPTTEIKWNNKMEDEMHGNWESIVADRDQGFEDTWGLI